jgi:hypothetical protein
VRLLRWGEAMVGRDKETDLKSGYQIAFARQQALGPSDRAQAARGRALALARSLGGVGQPLQLLAQRGLGARQQAGSRENTSTRQPADCKVTSPVKSSRTNS